MNNDRIFKITFFTKIGSAPWRPFQKQFCECEKELKKLVKKAKITTNRRNAGMRRECRFTVEEFLGNAWAILEIFPNEVDPASVGDVKPQKKTADKEAKREKWLTITANAQEAFEKYQEEQKEKRNPEQ